MCVCVCVIEDEYMTRSINIYGTTVKDDIGRDNGMMVAHRESTRLIWSPDVQHCNYFNRVLQNGF